jgi:hypothetical protein
MKRGFTLIETLCYLGLYTIIIGGMLSAIYGMFQSDAHNETQAMLEEEGDYLMGKINWVLSDTASVQSPTDSGNILTVIRSDGSSASISSVGGALHMREKVGTMQVLNNTNVSILNLTFLHLHSQNDGITPDGVSASFTMIATTSDGYTLHRDYATLQYLRI